MKSMKDRLKSISELLFNSSFVRYVIVGVGSLVVDYGLLIIGYHVIGLDLPVATTIAFVIGLLFNFTVNKLWAFQSRSKTVARSFREITLYGLLVVFNLLFTNIFIYYVYQAGIGPEISKIVTTALTTLWNFVIYKKVIFRQAPTDQRQ